MEKGTALGHWACNKGYALIEGKLEEVKLIRTDYERQTSDDGEMFYKDKTIVQRPNGSLFTMGQIQRDWLYESPEEYEKGTRMSVGTYNLKDRDVISKLFGERGNHRHDGEVYYTFSGGKAHKNVLSLVFLTYDYAKDRISLADYCVIPDSTDTYRSEQEAFDYNSYKVVDENGVEAEREGCNRLLFLDDDQKEMVFEFEKLVKKMENNGILLVTDCCDDIRAFNTRNISDYAMAYNENELEKDGKKWEECHRYSYQNEVNVSIANWFEDHTIYIHRKETNK